MFKLINVENNIELEMVVAGYQFPNSIDDNWCNIKIFIKQADAIFKIVDPALKTTELKIIHEWFKCLAERRLPNYAQLCFIEPCLEFEFLACTNDTVRISINLDHEMKPDFVMTQFGISTLEWSMVFELSKQNIDKITSGIEDALKSYPVRGKS